MSKRPARALFGKEQPNASWSDTDLVRACLGGDEQAWARLIEKYQALIFSIGARYHLPPEDCADIFQTVCLELFSTLPKLRKPGSLRSWVVSVAAHTSFHWKRRRRRREERERGDIEEDTLPAEAAVTPALLEELEQEQMVRDALARLPPRCREMIRLLFYEQPPLPYKEVAERLGLATGSIGFIRGRCLKRLAKALEKEGF
jgi:RNA polymerase sigma factor (sigma-70 family)